MTDYRVAALAFLNQEVTRAGTVRVHRRRGDEVTQMAQAVAVAEAAFDRQAIVQAYDGLVALYPTHILTDPTSYADHLVVICELIARLCPTRVVDAGCGVGIGTAFLAKAFPSVSFAAYDFAPAAVENAQRCASHHNLPNVRFHVLHHEDAPTLLGQGSADLVIARGSIGYLSSALPPLGNAADPQREITRLLRTNDPVLVEWYTQMRAVTNLVRSGGAVIDIHISFDPAIILRHFLYRQLGFTPCAEERRRIVEGSTFRYLDRHEPGWRQLVPLPEKIARLFVTRSELVNLYTR